VLDNGSAATVILGLDGAGAARSLGACRGARAGGGDHREPRGVLLVRGGGQAARPPPGVGAGPARRGAPGDLGVVEAGVALSRAGVPGADVDRGASGGVAAVVVDRAGPGGGMSPSRSGGHSVAQVATGFGVSLATVMAAVRDHGTLGGSRLRCFRS